MAEENAQSGASSTATQQLQQAAAAPPTPTTSGPIDNLQCQWVGCGERAASAEQLYEHVCNRHVGRKSTNNLNLVCAWGNCHTTTVKRDHITSHIRVHVPLKPHKCDFCGKCFKRPQDLKKHVKTHADDSVVTRSPEPSGANRHHQGGPYQSMGGPPRPTGYFGDGSIPQNLPMGYGYQAHGGNGNGNPAYYAPTQQQANTPYSAVFYGNGGGDVGNQAAQIESRKRHADNLNNFFGMIKSQRLDPTSYADISGHVQNLPTPMFAQNTGMLQYQPAPLTINGHSQNHGGGVYGPAGQMPYTLPIPNLRTKTDLITMDNILDQMTTTTYEHSAASHSQPPQMQSNGHALGPRPSNSPPGVPNMSTPDLTSDSGNSSNSYTSGHSPTSVTSNHSTHSMYPTLPNTASAHPGMAASALGTQFDADHRRRHSGGTLQKAAPGPKVEGSEDAMDIDIRPVIDPEVDDNNSKKSRASLSKHNIDPALAGDAASSEGSVTPTGQGHDDGWVETLKVLDGLRDLIRWRLEKGAYVDEEGDAGLVEALKKEQDEEVASLYPVLKD